VLSGEPNVKPTESNRRPTGSFGATPVCSSSGSVGWSITSYTRSTAARASWPATTTLVTSRASPVIVVT